MKESLNKSLGVELSQTNQSQTCILWARDSDLNCKRENWYVKYYESKLKTAKIIAVCVRQRSGNPLSPVKMQVHRLLQTSTEENLT